MKQFLTTLTPFKKLYLKLLIRLSGQKLFLAFYHSISDEKLAHICNIYPVRDSQLFTNDLDTISSLYNPVSLKDILYQIEKKSKFAKPSFHLSFDDGLKQIYTVVAPMLEKRGITATFFVNSAFIDNKSLFYRYKISLILEELKTKPELCSLFSVIDCFNTTEFETIKKTLLALKYNDIELIDRIAAKLTIDFDHFLKTEQPYLTTEQLTDLQNRGFCIASHSVDHPFFGEISFEEQKKQFTESAEYLEKKLKISDRFFSFPFSDMGVDAAFFKWMYSEQNCKLSFGTAGLKKDFDPRHLHRVAFDGSLRSAYNIIKSQYTNYLIKIFLNRNTVHRS